MALHSATAPPAPALSKVSRWLAGLEDALNLCAAAAIFFLMFVGVFQIVSRTVFGTAIYGYIDYIEQASPIFALLGIAYCQRLGAHVRMDLILRGLPETSALGDGGAGRGAGAAHRHRSDRQHASRISCAPGSAAIPAWTSACRSGRPS